jgi:hypothetical protein
VTKFNTTDRRSAANIGPLTVNPDTEHTNHQGGTGFGRDARSDLYLLATTSHDLTADAFYEAGDARVKRFADLAGRCATADPDWTYQFLTWLRTKGNMRTAALVGGVEAARAMVGSGLPGGRHMVSTVLRRADEPGEAVAYHLSRYGRTLPKAVKRGIADAATRLYNEYALLKYDTGTHGVRFADVLDLTHPTPAAPWQADLFRYAIDRRHGHDDIQQIVGDGEGPALPMVYANIVMRSQWASDAVAYDLDPERLKAAGLTWEDVMSAVGGNVVDKAVVWRNLIPAMGFMARLRNLRNFDQAGLTDADVADVTRMLADPDAVRASKQLPLRFLSAYRAAPSLRWSYPLQQALDVAVENIPAVGGRTLILIDTSGSMRDRLSERSDLARWDAAAAFGLALARRCATVDVVSYSGGASRGYALHDAAIWEPRTGESLLTSITRWNADGFMLGGGTDTVGALRNHYAGHDRTVLLTDEQDGGYWGRGQKVTDQMPSNRPLYTFNLAGYESSHAATDPYRITLGGLTDAMFGVITQVENRRPGQWPWTGDPDIPALPTYPAPTGATTR